MWVALSTTDIHELRDELGRQAAEWDHLVESLLNEVHGGRVEDQRALSLVATVDGLSMRLMADRTARTRRDAVRAFDDALLAAGLAG